MEFLAVLAAVVLIATPILAISAFLRIQRLNEQFRNFPLQDLATRFPRSNGILRHWKEPSGREAKTLRIQPNEFLTRLDLGPEEITSNYADPRPFTERHPNLLWVALGLAIVLLGYAALRALRTPDSPAQ
jgi:hypothetical protein